VDAPGPLRPLLDLLARIGRDGPGAPAALAGWQFLDGEQSEYFASPYDALYHMRQDAFGHRPDWHTIDMVWSPPTVTIDITCTDGRAVRYELQPLSPAQADFAYRIAHVGMGNAGVAALELPDPVAAIASRITPRDMLDAVDPAEYDPDDPLGFLGFAQDLLEAGVGDWGPDAVAVLTDLAEDWTGSAQDLLDVAAQLGVHR
jgi:hypothetical protein